jgi:8-amino-7-oxononanoate synthase
MSDTRDAVFDWVDERADARSAAGLTRRLRPRPAKSDVLELSGNDYLGFSRDKRVVGAAAAAALKWGAGATGSRLVSGTTELHAELERELAAFCGAQAALVFSSGYAANLGAVTALAGKDTAIVAEQYMHASLIDACRQSRAQVAVARHCDVAAVDRALATRKVPRAMMITESVFSVDGDVAPLADIAASCRAHGAALLIDDAHGFGVIGDGGRGGVHEAGLSGDADVVTTMTLSKSLGAQGGAVLGPRRVIAHLVNSARSFIFDTGLAPASAGAALTALNLLREDPQRPARALWAASELSRQLLDKGLPASTPASAVVSVRAPSADAAVSWAAAIREQDIAVGCFRPPSAPDDVSRLRLTARADLTEAEIDRAVRVVTETAPR